jgi:hypothetical protein
MNHVDISHAQVVGPGWEMLGEIELGINPDIDHTISKWLMLVFSPLKLQAEFVDKILLSARDSMARAMQAEAVMKFEHVHLLVFAPTERGKESGTWGFFRIEKVETGGESGNPDHAIEFYLYLEGH